MLESTITAKGQTTLPKGVRDLLGLRPGDRVRYLVSGGQVRLLRPRKVMTLCGSLRGDTAPERAAAAADDPAPERADR